MAAKHGWGAVLRASTALVSASLLVVAAAPATAQPVWTGPGTDFNTGTNWSGGTAPVAASNPTFQNNGAPTSLSTSGSVGITGLTFDAGAPSRVITLGSNLAVTGNVTNNSGAEQTIAAGDQLVQLSGQTGTNVTYSNTLGGIIAIQNGSAGGDSTFQLNSGRLTVSGAAASVTLGSLSGSGNVSNFGGGTITTTIGTLGTSTTFSGAIENTGAGDIAIVKAGGGTLTLTGANSYSGGTTISAGTLQIGNGGTTGTLGTGNVVDNAALAFNRSDGITVTNIISGNGSVAVLGGTVQLSAVNSYSGGTTVTNGFLQVAANSALGSASGGLTFDNGHLTTTASFSSNRAITLEAGGGVLQPVAGTTLTQTGVISGVGGLAMNGPGTLVLSGVNTYQGRTALVAGVVSIAADSALGSGAAQLFLNGGTLQTTDNLTMSRHMEVQTASGNLRPDAGTTLTLSGPITSVSGTGLTMDGAGTLMLTGTNSYGATTITSGTLRVGDGGATGTLGSGNVVNNAALVFDRTGTLTIAGAISGTGTLTQAGTGRTILTADNSYAGTTTISAGTLQIGNGGTSGTLGTGNVVNNAALVFNRSDGGNIGNTISGSGSVAYTGIGSYAATAVNSYTGGTSITGGAILAIAANSALGASSGSLTLDAGTLETSANITSSRAITLNASGGTFGPSAGTTLALNGVISGTGGLAVNGPGTVMLGGVNIYSGATQLIAGVTQIAADSALGNGGPLFVNGGSLRTTADLTMSREVNLQTDGGELRPDAGTALTLSGTVSGFDLMMNGAGALVLTGTNVYDTTTINSGTLRVGDGVTTGTLGAGAVVNNAALVFNNPGTSIVAGAISGTGTLTQQGAGVTVLAADNTYSGATTISGGTLQIGTGGTTGTLGTAAVTNNGTLGFNRSNDITVSNVISGTGRLVQGGAGVVTLGADNTYSGGTFFNAGFIQVSSDARLGDASGGLTFGGGGLATTASFASARSITLNAGNGTFAPAVSTTLRLTGPISGSGGLIMSGAGRLELNAGNTFQAGTAITSGVLAIAADSALGNAAGPLQMTGGALVTTADVSMTRAVQLLNATAGLRPDAGTKLTLSGAISDLGPPAGFVMDGAGTLVLAGTNTYSGTTTISSGTLQIGAGIGGGAMGTLGSGGVVNNAALVLNRTGVFTVAGAISGTGTVTQAGAGTTVLTGDNSYSGTTTISAGTLQIGDGGSSGTLGGGSVVNNGVLAFDRDLLDVPSPISGTGQVRQVGTGTTT
jgi:fibronectin-binding autotransporter adhesin